MPSPSPGFAGGAIRPRPPLPLPVRALSRPRPGRRRRRARRGLPITMGLYLAAEVLQVFMVALTAIVLVYVTVVAFQLVRDGIRLGFVWPHLLRTMAYPLFFSIPLAFLFAITLGLGRMANDQELSALRAQGVSHLEMAVPLAAVALALSGLTFYLAGWVLPEVHYEQANLRETILSQLGQLGSGRNRSLLLPGNVSLWVKRYDGPRLTGLYLDIPERAEAQILPELGDIAGELARRRLSGSTGRITLVAREAEIEVAGDRSRVVLWLTGVDMLMPEEVSTPRGRDVFHQRLSIDKLPLPLSFARKGESAKDMSNGELSRWTRSLRQSLAAVEADLRSASAGRAPPPLSLEGLRQEVSYQKRRLAQAEVEFHGRLTFSFACLTFPLVALPLVVLLERRGRLTHFFLGNLAVVVVFFPMVMAGHLAADRGWPAALAMALPNLALAVPGGVLFRAMLSR